jgi:hypothetical protein
MGTTQRERWENLTFGSNSQESRERLRQLILFIAERCQPDPTFGMTKLAKILYRADFESFARYGKSITGIQYKKFQYGPMSQAALDVRDEMKRRGEIAVVKERHSAYPRDRVVPLEAANLAGFNGNDIALIDGVIQMFHGHTATFVSEFSHDRAWRAAGDFEAIPYEAALLSDHPYTEDDVARARELNDKYRWDD